MFVKPKQKPNNEPLPIVRLSSPACTKPNVTCSFSSRPQIKITTIDKYWTEMSTWEKVEAGPFLCIINPDEFDKSQGKFVEYMILYKNYSEYETFKKNAIESGAWERLSHS